MDSPFVDINILPALLLPGRRFLRFRNREGCVSDGDGRSYAGLLVENFRHVPRQADAAMGDRAAAHLSYMQPQARVGKPLPVGHGGAVKAASLRNGVRGFGIVVDAFAFGIIHLAVEVGGVVFLFGDDGVVSRLGRVRLDAGGEGKVHGDQAVHQVLAPLFVQADEDVAGFLRLAVQQGVILVDVVCFPVVLAGYEVGIRGRMERVFVFRDGFVHGTRVRQGRVALTGMGAGHPPHEDHREDGQKKEMLHKR